MAATPSATAPTSPSDSRLRSSVRSASVNATAREIPTETYSRSAGGTPPTAVKANRRALLLLSDSTVILASLCCARMA